MSRTHAVVPGTNSPRRIPHLGISISWTLAGYIAYMACQWVMLVVVARLGSPEKVGEFALGLVISAPVVLFANLGLRRLQVTDATGQFLFADYFGLRLLTSALALGAIAAIALASGYPSSAVAVILAMGLAKTVESLSDVMHGVLQLGERMDLLAGSLFLRGVTGVGGLALGLVATRSVGMGVLGMAVGWAAVFFLYDLPLTSRIMKARGMPGGLRPSWKARVLGRLAWLALPLGVVAVLGSLMATIPSVLIEKYRGAAELGIYTALAYSYLACHRIASAMGESSCARLARHYAAGRKSSFLRVMAGLLGLAGSVGLTGLGLAFFTGRPLLTFLYGPVYGERADLLVGFMLVAIVGVLANLLDYGMSAMRRLKVQPLIHGGALLLYAALGATFIPALGSRGAVLALGIVSGLQFLASLCVVVWALMRFPAPPDATLLARA